MLRTLTATVLLAMALPFAASTEAFAGNPELKAQKQEVKAAKKYSKQVDKWVKKWEKGAARDKDKKMAKADAELDVILRAELGRLRDLGVKTRAVEPQPADPSRPDKVIVLAPEHPKMESLRDDLVELRDLQPQFDDGRAKNKDYNRKSALLANLADNVGDRYERKDKQYRDAKSG